MASVLIVTVLFVAAVSPASVPSADRQEGAPLNHGFHSPLAILRNKRVSNDPSNDPTNLPRLPPGHVCSTSEECVNNSVCNTTEDSIQPICVCVDTHYSDYRSCLKRLPPGEPCSYSVTDTVCVLGAVCHCPTDRDCRCHCSGKLLADFYDNVTDTCKPRGRHGEGCDEHQLCVANANCNYIHQCECETHHFYVAEDSFCRARLLVNQTCSETKQCVENAECSNGVCTCTSGFHVAGDRCDPRLPLDSPCGDSSQCLENGECFSSKCRCKSDSYIDRTRCTKTIGFNGYCDFYNHEERQCVNNSSCVFRAIDDKPKCACDMDHFYDGHFCLTRAKVLQSCPLDNVASVNGIPEVDKQCVENAFCNATTHLCNCNPGHYFRSNRCPQRIALGGTCDPWSNYPEQCQAGLKCLYGTCRTG